MKKTNKRTTGFLKQKSYLLAMVLMLAAAFGMTGVYLSEQRKEKNEQARLEAEANELAAAQQEEETAAANQVIPAENTDFLDSPEVIASIPKEETTETSLENSPAEETTVEPMEPQVYFDSEELVWPLMGTVLMNYSMEQTVYFATLDQYKYNPAIIIRGNVNDPVMSVADGIVRNIETNEETGCTVSVDIGDGYCAVYGQLKEVAVNAGDYVNAETILGYVSEPTKYYSLEGPNLYFQLLKENESVDPMEYLQ